MIKVAMLLMIKEDLDHTANISISVISDSSHIKLQSEGKLAQSIKMGRT